VWAIAKLVIKEIFRKKDFYVALILSGAILFYASQIKFYNVGNITRYLLEMGLAISFILSVILSVSLAARQFPSELAQKTCFVILAKPVTRFEFMAGKMLGSFLASAACFLLFYGGFVAIVFPKSSDLSAAVIFQTGYLFLLNLMILTAVASGLSYFLTTSANIAITLVLYFLVGTYGASLKESSAHLFWLSRILSQGVYYLLPHFEFFDMRTRLIHGWGALSWHLVGFLTLYAGVYSIAFLGLGWLGFRKRVL
jgi:ABC-type transport system involved in multi-copper enzyme maturation permease subunit